MRRLLLSSRAAAAAVSVAAGAAAGPAAAQPRPAAPACAPDNAGLALPAGFCATLFAEGLVQPRHGVVAPTGELLVNSRTTGGIVALVDADGDGRAETVRKVADAGGTGIALANGALYATWGTAIVRYPLVPGTVQVSGGPDTVVRDLPTGGHTAHNFVVDGATLYVNIGSRTNSCQEQDRRTQSKGVDPCVELETRAGIWTFDANGRQQTPAQGKRFATGIRNAVAMARHPGDGALWAMQHGRDQLLQNWAPMFDETYSAENPAEELLRVGRNDDFGWPYCYTVTATKQKILAPEYGGDGREVGRCRRAKAAVYPFPGHWAPNAMHFYTGTQFPARYRDGVFVAFHGSWNRAPLPQAGFQVAFLPLRRNVPAGAHETFADGFVQRGPEGPPTRTSRPTGLAQGLDGSLFVMDDAGGKVYRIAYVGPARAAGDR